MIMRVMMMSDCAPNTKAVLEESERANRVSTVYVWRDALQVSTRGEHFSLSRSLSIHN